MRRGEARLRKRVSERESGPRLAWHEVGYERWEQFQPLYRRYSARHCLHDREINLVMAFPHPPGLLPSEVAFLCEMELINVVPRQRLERLDLLGVSLACDLDNT